VEAQEISCVEAVANGVRYLAADPEDSREQAHF
jgi:hypothetical protein